MKYHWLLTESEKGEIALYIHTFEPSDEEIKQFVLELIYKNHKIEDK